MNCLTGNWYQGGRIRLPNAMQKNQVISAGRPDFKNTGTRMERQCSEALILKRKVSECSNGGTTFGCCLQKSIIDDARRLARLVCFLFIEMSRHIAAKNATPMWHPQPMTGKSKVAGFCSKCSSAMLMFILPLF